MSYLDNLYTPPVLNESEEAQADQTPLNEKTASEWRDLGMKLRGMENQMTKKAINFTRRSKEKEGHSFYTPNKMDALLAQHRATRLSQVANNVFSHANGVKWRTKDLLK